MTEIDFFTMDDDISEFSHILNAGQCESCGGQTEVKWSAQFCGHCDWFTNPVPVS